MSDGTSPHPATATKGTRMDKKEAQEALDSAEALASRMRRGARLYTPLLLVLGLLMIVMTAVYGLVVQPSAPYAVPVVLLLPFFALVIHTATRPVLPRRHRTLYAIITGTGAAVYSLTITLGSAVFSGEPLWWLPGAVLCGVPFFVIGFLARRAVGAMDGTP
ncbi:hypothetical protein SMCF_8252 [Streptomyces coelicoflavus ZG0656]|nr:hypothetical protein SMCF_8252 [Streptomyces coelicoflavus ZG0656]MZE43531.1 hypothetical protein [Streptomyces sp. SID5477]